MSRFAENHPRGANGGPLFLGDELCPICECCSLSSIECESCGGDGFSGHDCGEDTCCCLDPEDDQPCDICEGHGGFMACIGGCDFSRKTPHGDLANPREKGDDDGMEYGHPREAMEDRN